MPLFRAGIILFLMAAPLFVNGQDAGFDSFISRISGQYKVDVAIAPELVPTLDSIKNVGTEITSIQELLYRLLNHSGITYQIIDGNKLMLRREDPTDDHQMLAVLVGTVTDDQSGEPLPFATVIASNGNNACNTDCQSELLHEIALERSNRCIAPVDEHCLDHKEVVVKGNYSIEHCNCHQDIETFFGRGHKKKEFPEEPCHRGYACK